MGVLYLRATGVMVERAGVAAVEVVIVHRTIRTNGGVRRLGRRHHLTIDAGAVRWTRWPYSKYSCVEYGALIEYAFPRCTNYADILVQNIGCV